MSEELSRPSQSSSRRPPAAGAKGGTRVREEEEMERVRSISRASSTPLESVDSLDVPPDIFVEESDENGAIRMRRVTAGEQCWCLLLLLSNATCS